MKIIDKLEDWLHNIIDRYLFQIAIVLLVVLSAVIRRHLSPILMLSDDYLYSLVPWVEFYKEHGILEGLSLPVGSYYIPYNLFLAIIAFLPWEPWVMISLTSVLCDYVAAFFVYKIAILLLKEADGNQVALHSKAMLAGAVSLYLPATIMNGALWKQCDSVYTCFVIIALYYLLRDKYGRSLFWLGVGFVFKQQAIFIFPLYVVLYFFRRKGLRAAHFFWIPAWYLIGGLPAILAGRRFTNVMGIYLKQVNYQGFDAMTINFPNLYSFGLSDYPALQMPAIVCTLAIFIIFMCAVMRYRASMDRTNTVFVGIWSLWTCVMFLPAMHERYNYPVLILLTMFYMVRDIRKIWTAIVINWIAAMQYGSYLFSSANMSLQTMAVFHFIAYFYVTYDLMKSMKATHEKNMRSKEYAEKN